MINKYPQVTVLLVTRAWKLAPANSVNPSAAASMCCTLIAPRADPALTPSLSLVVRVSLVTAAAAVRMLLAAVAARSEKEDL